MISISDFVLYPLNLFLIYPKGPDAKPDTSKYPDYFKLVGLVPDVSEAGDKYFKVYTLFDKSDNFGYSVIQMSDYIKGHNVAKVSGLVSKDKNYNDTIRFSSFEFTDQKFSIDIVK